MRQFFFLFSLFYFTYCSKSLNYYATQKIDYGRYTVATYENFAILSDTYAKEIKFFKLDYSTKGWNEYTTMNFQARAGGAVGISKTHAIVGATDIEGINPGAFIYQLVNGTWTFQTFLNHSDAIYGTEYGHSVAIDGDYAIVGSIFDDDGGTNAGAAYIYHLNNENIWELSEKVYVVHSQSSFGQSVAIYDGGSTIRAVVGARDTGSKNYGRAYIYKKDQSDSAWKLEQELYGSETNNYDSFGYSVSMYKDKYVIVGAFSADVDGKGSVGDAYVFESEPQSILTTDFNWNEVVRLTPSQLLGYDTFGKAVAISEYYTIVTNVKTSYSPYTSNIYVYKTGNWSDFMIIDDKELNNDETIYGLGNDISLFENKLLIGGSGNTMFVALGCSELKCENGIPDSNCEFCICENSWTIESNCSKCGLIPCLVGTPNSDCTACEGTEFYCDGIVSTNKSVCSSQGSCQGLNYCDCNDGFIGDFCEKEEESMVWLISIISIGVISTIIIILLIVSLIVGIIFCCLCKKANRFDHIKDIDMIVKEAELEQLDETPKIRPNQKSILIDFKEIQLKTVISSSSGSGATVYLAKWQGRECVYKSFKASMISNDTTNLSSFEEFEKEVQICMNVNHPSILQFYGAVVAPPKVGLLLELCRMGDLSNFLFKYREENEKCYPIDQKLRIIQEICSGMIYFHSRQYIHRDLKPENILINGEEKSKIMDFGLSRKLENSDEQTMTKRIGTSSYMAPEVISGKKYSFSCDIFSFSILIYVIITENFFPYGIDTSDSKLFQKLTTDPSFRPKINESVFKECKFLLPIIKKNWSFNPEERNSFKEIFEQLEKE